MEFSTLSADSFEVKITTSKICAIGTVLVLALGQPSRFAGGKALLESVFTRIPFPQALSAGIKQAFRYILLDMSEDCGSVFSYRGSSALSMET